MFLSLAACVAVGVRLSFLCPWSEPQLVHFSNPLRLLTAYDTDVYQAEP